MCFPHSPSHQHDPWQVRPAFDASLLASPCSSRALCGFCAAPGPPCLFTFPEARDYSCFSSLLFLICQIMGRKMSDDCLKEEDVLDTSILFEDGTVFRFKSELIKRANPRKRASKLRHISPGSDDLSLPKGMSAHTHPPCTKLTMLSHRNENNIRNPLFLCILAPIP